MKAGAAVGVRASLARRLMVALPDAVTSGLFVVTWLEPLRLGAAAVKTGLIVMLLEFLVVHSSGFFAVFVYDPEASRMRRTLAVIGLSLFYFLFVAVWVAVFEEWWPLAAFGWLVLSRLGSIWVDPMPVEVERGRQIGLWAVSVLLYLVGAFATALLPLPHLGITPELRSALGFSGGGVWEEEPHRVIAFGALYFAALAVVKPLVGPARTRGAD